MIVSKQIIYNILVCLKKIWISKKILRKEIYFISVIFLISQQTRKLSKFNNVLKNILRFFYRYDKKIFIYVNGFKMEIK